jgi:hypothetical protein
MTTRGRRGIFLIVLVLLIVLRAPNRPRRRRRPRVGDRGGFPGRGMNGALEYWVLE